MKALCLLACVVCLATAGAATSSGRASKGRPTAIGSQGTRRSAPIHHSWRYYRAMARGLAADRAELRRANRVLRSHLAASRRSLRVVSAAHRRLLRRSGTASSGRYSSRYAIHLAAVTYRQSESDLLRVAECESPGLDPTLVNRQPIYNGEHATGLFQFIPSTWASTPFASFDIFEPVANSLAAGWMWSNGRRREWACQ